MKAPNQLVSHILEQMSDLGPVRARPMFGGYGIFFEDLMFALVAYDTLYFKTDDTNRPDFVELEREPFTYEAKSKVTLTSYHQAPEEVFDDKDAMTAWATSGLKAAQRAASKKAKKK